MTDLDVDTLPLASQVLPPGGRDRNELPTAGGTRPLQKAALVGVLPYGKAGARRPPRLYYFDIGPGRRADPLQKIQDQGFRGVRHA